jgi:hypothetical protein
LNLPSLTKVLYGIYQPTGLYSFEFVDKNRNTITEIFFMPSLRGKSTSEQTRASVVPTLSSNYVNDAGNATKNITLTGKLYFNNLGSPSNPLAKDITGLDDVIDGMNEFLKIRWMTIRYRDYCMTKKAKMTVPTTVMNYSPEITALYKKVAKNVKNKVGALYDEIRLIFHDYDTDDHYFAKVDTFSSNQVANEYNAIEYTIALEGYELDNIQKKYTDKVKTPTNELINNIDGLITKANYEENFDNVQDEISYNSDFLSTTTAIGDNIESIHTENESIQSGKTTALTSLPYTTSTLLTNVDSALDSFTTIFLSSTQKTSYDAGTLSIDEVVNTDLLFFYNSMQRIKIQAESLQGVINSIVKQEEIRYYANANDYSLTTEQFDSGDENIVENDSSFYYYTIMEGDSLRLIAQRELGDSEKFISLLKINNISENDFIDNSMVGQKIKIPFIESVIARSPDNLVYETDITDIEKFLYGSDIGTGINKDL